VLCRYPGNVGMRPGFRVAQILNIAFDMGAWEILGSLSNGCTLCLRGNKSYEWVALMKTVDVVISTPSILTRHDPADYPNIKYVITGGEVCPQSLADRWARYTNFHNCCGPSEISIVNTIQLHEHGTNVSIGTPIANTNVYILDEELKPVPIGEKGSMWVGGVGVSRGYVNLPELSARRWKPDPFLGNGQIMFNTGDLGCWRPDGQLDHLGRADDQVKVKGFRVELDGVSAAIRTCPSITASVVLLVNQELWGFVTPSSVDLHAVKEATAAVQPYYAVPTQYVALAEFPQTKNGKVDKRALSALAEELSGGSPPGSSSGFSAAGSVEALSSTLRSSATWLEAQPPPVRLSAPSRSVPFGITPPATPGSVSPSPSSSAGRSSTVDSYNSSVDSLTQDDSSARTGSSLGLENTTVIIAQDENGRPIECLSPSPVTVDGKTFSLLDSPSHFSQLAEAAALRDIPPL